MQYGWTNSDTSPLFVPVKCFDRQIVTASQNDAQRGVDGKTSNIIWMCLEGSDFLVCIVIENPQLEVVRSRNEPVFSRNKTDTTDGHFGDFEGFDEGACFVVVDVNAAVIKTGDKPWLCRMEVYSFDTIGALQKFSLHNLVIFMNMAIGQIG